MINSNKRNLHSNIKLYGAKLEVDKFKYIGAIITKDGLSGSEIKIRLSPAILAMVKLTTMCKLFQYQFKAQI